MKFLYTAKDATGATKKGTIDAPTKLAAADKLFSELQLTVLDLTEADAADAKAAASAPQERIQLAAAPTPASTAAKKPVAPTLPKAPSMSGIQNAFKELNQVFINMSGVGIQDKVIFFRLLAVMINAGLPIVKALGILADQTKNPRLKMVIGQIQKDVESGRGFSHALSDYEDIFTDAELGVIASGETSGQLNAALLDLATTTEKSASLKRKVKGALIYPGVVVSIVVLVTIAVMTLVIPKLKELFEGSGNELPPMTQGLITISDWFTGSTLSIPNWLFIFLAIGAALFGIKTLKKTREGRHIWDGLMLRMPIFGGLIRKMVLATIARQLSTLTGSGISIIKAIEITGNAAGNEVYRTKLIEIKAEVEAGRGIAAAIAGDPLFPPLFQSIVAIGEQTAQLASVTKKVAEFYEEEVDDFVKNLSTIMEPVIIVVMGALVGGLVAAIMQPIMQIADIASQG